MKFRLSYLLVVLAFAFPTMFAQKREVTKDVLLETTKAWDGSVYSAYPKGQPKIFVLKITIPAHTQMSWHEHPVINAAYIVSGDLMVEKKDGTTMHAKAGEVVPELLDIPHRGVAGDTDVVLIVFYAGIEGTPLSREEK